MQTISFGTALVCIITVVGYGHEVGAPGKGVLGDDGLSFGEQARLPALDRHDVQIARPPGSGIRRAHEDDVPAIGGKLWHSNPVGKGGEGGGRFGPQVQNSDLATGKLVCGIDERVAIGQPAWIIAIPVLRDPYHVGAIDMHDVHFGQAGTVGPEGDACTIW